jgi:NAD(P)-dependent dehydrogenase (short-subunit alcohol dehydrogenase family)
MTKQPMTKRLVTKQPAALITGAAKRIGRALALALAQNGHAVAIHYNQSQADARSLQDEIMALGGEAEIVQADLSDETQTTGLIERAAEALGRPLSVLINNASTFEHDDITTATRQSWDSHMEANLRAPFVLIQDFAAQFPKTDDGFGEGMGNIINIIDERVWNLTPAFVTYTLSKAGLWTLTQTMALALAPHIRVNAIGPGPTLASSRQTAEQFAAQCAPLPLGHGANPDDICQAVLYILGARAMTGQMIALDGGQHMAWSGYTGHGTAE